MRPINGPIPPEALKDHGQTVISSNACQPSRSRARLSPRKHLTELIWTYLAPCADIDDISAACSGRYLAFYADHLLFRAIRDIAEPLNDREFPVDKILMGGQAYTLSMNTFRTARCPAAAPGITLTRRPPVR